MVSDSERRASLRASVSRVKTEPPSFRGYVQKSHGSSMRKAVVNRNSFDEKNVPRFLDVS